MKKYIKADSQKFKKLMWITTIMMGLISCKGRANSEPVKEDILEASIKVDTIQVIHDTIYIPLPVESHPDSVILNKNKSIQQKSRDYLEATEYFNKKVEESELYHQQETYRTIVTPGEYSEKVKSDPYGYNPNRNH